MQLYDSKQFGLESAEKSLPRIYSRRLGLPESSDEIYHLVSYEQLEDSFSADAAYPISHWGGRLFRRTKRNDPRLCHCRDHEFYFVFFLGQDCFGDVSGPASQP